MLIWPVKRTFQREYCHWEETRFGAGYYRFGVKLPKRWMRPVRSTAYGQYGPIFFHDPGARARDLLFCDEYFQPTDPLFPIVQADTDLLQGWLVFGQNDCDAPCWVMRKFKSEIAMAYLYIAEYQCGVKVSKHLPRSERFHNFTTDNVMVSY
jgi:hypothetical protein